MRKCEACESRVHGHKAWGNHVAGRKHQEWANWHADRVPQTVEGRNRFIHNLDYPISVWEVRGKRWMERDLTEEEDRQCHAQISEAFRAKEEREEATINK